MDRETAAIAAGATAFLHYDQWLRVGTAVERHMRNAEKPYGSIGRKRFGNSHGLNAPSPAEAASLAIGSYIASATGS
jgi:hypothetical protein